MMFKTVLTLFAISIGMQSFSPEAPGNIRQMSLTMKVRKIRDRRVLKYDVDLLYKSNGEMVSWYPAPNNRYILTNNQGDLRIYNPDSNLVRITRQEVVSVEGSFLDYFINEETESMGMESYGFELDSVEVVEGKRIAIWKNAAMVVPKGAAAQVRMVHEAGKIIYLGYEGPNGEKIRRDFYMDYKDVAGTWFPGRVISYTWLSPADSIVEDTRYEDFKVNEEVDSPLLNFEIPENVEIR